LNVGEIYWQKGLGKNVGREGAQRRKRLFSRFTRVFLLDYPKKLKRDQVGPVRSLERREAEEAVMPMRD